MYLKECSKSQKETVLKVIYVSHAVVLLQFID
jgi:hypothetical protein